MKQQTAVKWLTNELELYHNGESKLLYVEIIEKAEQMEKEQIVKAYNISWHNRMNPYKIAEKYYNETYK